jgi:hypothetical protein
MLFELKLDSLILARRMGLDIAAGLSVDFLGSARRSGEALK